MLEFLYEFIYVLLIATLILNFAIAKMMDFFNMGEAKILSPIIGTALGWLTFWLAPLSIAGIVVGVIATIIANLVLTKAVYPKLGDKMDALVDNKINTSRNKDINKTLHSATAEERVKYLCRNMRYNYYYLFRYSVDSALVFQTVKKAIENSNLLAEYPEVKMTSGDGEKSFDLLFSVSTNVASVGITFLPAAMNRQDVYMLGIYAYGDDGKLKERIAFENKVGHILDKIYMLSSNAIKAVDPKFNADFVPFKAPF